MRGSYAVSASQTELQDGGRMTKDDIIRMAKEARFYVKDDEAYSPSNQEDHELTEYLERFAKLVAEHERNEIIEILDASTGYVHMDAIRERT
jgi:hypothetical protein